MELTLNHEEQDLLLRIVENHLLDLEREISHTDRRDFRLLLKDQRVLLEHLRARLQEVHAAA